VNVFFFSPIGWDKSYPLKPVKNSEHSLTQKPKNSNKYSGNYGPKMTNSSVVKRGMSLERSFTSKKMNQSFTLCRTQSQVFVGSSSEESYTSSRPQSGFEFNKMRCGAYVSSDESHNPENKRDYTRPLPPSYKKLTNISSNTDSAYSSHNSERSEHKYIIKNSCPNLDIRTNLENGDGYKVNSQTFRKQKSPMRKPYRESKSRSDDLTDDESLLQSKVKKSERQREEDRRRMQFEMRKREQELLAKIKDQQRELEVIKLEKYEVEKELKKKSRENSTMNPSRVLSRERMKSFLKEKKGEYEVSENSKNFSREMKHGCSTSQSKSTENIKMTTQRRSVFAPKPRNDLVQCKKCGRYFAEDRIEKHENICSKTFNKKRKKFDMTKARVKGTDAAKFVKSEAQMKNQKVSKKGDWRKKRKEFIDTLRAAKLAQKHLAAGGSLKDLPPPPPMDTSDYIQCPHCLRRFSDSVADRHIPKCKDIKSNKKH